MAVPNVVSKLDGLDDGDEVRVETEGYEVEGTVECPDVVLNAERPRNRSAHVQVLIDEDTAVALGSVWCHVTLSAHRGRDGWSDVELSFVDEVDSNGHTESSTSLGEVEAVERID